MLVPKITRELQEFCPHQTVILGELCFDDVTKTSKDVGTILRCKPEKAQQRQKDAATSLHFKMFDCLAWNGEDYTNVHYDTRFKSLVERMDSDQGAFGRYLYIHMCDFTEENFEDFLQEILANGGEGIVIHSKDYKYAPGSRPAWSTMKVKKIVENLEAPIVAFIEPNKEHISTDGNAASWQYWEGTYDDGSTVRINHAPCNIDMEAGLTWMPVTKPYYYDWKNGVVINYKGNDVRVTSGMCDDDRQWLATPEAATMLENGELTAVVTCMEITEDSLRHPRLIRIRTEA